MRVDLFDYELPDRFIATAPARPRDAARLLDLTGAAPADRRVRDLPDLLRPGDLLVGNDARVIPARLRGRRGDASVELTLHKPEKGEPKQGGCWAAFARPARRLRLGDSIRFAEDFAARVVEKRPGGEVLLAFEVPADGLIAALHRHGAMPLPPYIRRPEGAAAADRHDYQTLFARRDGAVAAPTAGLHFTDTLLAALERRGVGLACLTLLVGAGTFLPVRAADTAGHRMHAEWGEIRPEICTRINRARAAGGRILAIGTTSLRLLESATGPDGVTGPFCGETDLFITPGYRFRAVDLLLTNFHLPRSTLLMLVAAMAGRDRILAAYDHAKREGYRFYSYGDCCLLTPHTPAAP